MHASKVRLAFDRPQSGEGTPRCQGRPLGSFWPQCSLFCLVRYPMRRASFRLAVAAFLACGALLVHTAHASAQNFNGFGGNFGGGGNFNGFGGNFGGGGNFNGFGGNFGGGGNFI